MKMSVFFKKEPVSWTLSVRTEEFEMLENALKQFKIKLNELQTFKNGNIEVQFECVCNDLMKIGVEFGRLITEKKMEKFLTLNKESYDCKGNE